jgi:toxin ParE1/3/4
MRVEYSKRAIADLRNIAAYHLQSDDPRVAAAIETRIRNVVARIARSPESAPPVMQRPGIRVMLVLRYPYKILSRNGRQDQDCAHTSYGTAAVVGAAARPPCPLSRPHSNWQKPYHVSSLIDALPTKQLNVLT